MLFYNTCPVYTGIDIDFYSLTTGFWFKLYNIIYTQCSKSATKSRPKKKKEKKGGIDFIILIFFNINTFTNRGINLIVNINLIQHMKISDQNSALTCQAYWSTHYIHMKTSSNTWHSCAHISNEKRQYGCRDNFQNLNICPIFWCSKWHDLYKKEQLQYNFKLLCCQIYTNFIKKFLLGKNNLSAK